MRRLAGSLVGVVLVFGCPGPVASPDAELDAASARLDARGDAATSDGGPLDAPGDGGVAETVIDDLVRTFETADDEAAWRAFRAVSWGRGWPVVEGQRLLFATRQDDRPSTLSLVSDINGWDPSRHVARARDRTYWIVVEAASLTRPAQGAKYKWRVGAEFRAPWEATRYGYDENGRFGWVQVTPGVAHLEVFPAFEAAGLSGVRDIRAFVPAAFDAERARVLVLHDGQNVFHPDAIGGGWRVDEALTARGDNVLALAVDNAADRFELYTPTRDDIGSGEIGGQADAYLRAIENDLLPFVRARWGVRATGRSLAMMGSSLGGLVTLYAASRDWQSVGCAAGMSSTIGWGSIGAARRVDATLIGRWSGVHGALYVDYGGSSTRCFDGDADGVEDDADDGDNYCVNRQFLARLGAMGYREGVNLTSYWDSGAGHNEAAWASRVGRALDACVAMGWTAP